jgi:hypothetical protein
VIAYVITQPWTEEVLLTDGTWGNYEQYWEKAWTSTSLVMANRRARQVNAVVCAILKPSLEDALEDSPKPEVPLESSGQPRVSAPRSAGLF